MSTDPGDLNWNDLKFFLALARRGRLATAAKDLRCTHVTVANRLEHLETATGIRLFTQTRQGFRLTRDGQDLLPFAEECERQLTLASNRRGGEDLQSRPSVRVGVTEGIGHNYFAKLFGSWVAQRHIELEFVTLPKLSRVTRRDANICVTMEEPEGKNIIKQLLVPYRLGIYASQGYLETAGPIDGREDLRAHPWIGYVEDLLFSSTLAYDREVSDALDYAFRGTTLLSQVEAVRAGVGLAILPHYVTPGTGFKRVLPEIEFERTYWISATADLRQLEGHYAVWQLIRSACKRDRELFLSGDLVP